MTQDHANAVTPTEKIRGMSVHDKATGCRIWQAKTNPAGEPAVRIRRRWVRVRYYLMANEFPRNGHGDYPYFENTCDSGPLCIARHHMKHAGYVAKGESK